jgi:hypothetical protein
MAAAAAPPRLADHAGRCVIEAAGLAEKAGARPFGAKRDTDQRRGFDRAQARRENTGFEVMDRPCRTLGGPIARPGGRAR